MFEAFIITAAWASFAGMTAIAAVDKGRSPGWVIPGLLLGPAAFLLVLMLPAAVHLKPPRGFKPCAWCAEHIRADAVVCIRCGNPQPSEEEPDIVPPAGNVISIFSKLK